MFKFYYGRCSEYLILIGHSALKYFCVMIAKLNSHTSCMVSVGCLIQYVLFYLLIWCASNRGTDDPIDHNRLTASWLYSYYLLFHNHTLQFKSLGSVRFFKMLLGHKVFCAHQGCFYMIKNAVINIYIVEYYCNSK